MKIVRAHLKSAAPYSQSAPIRSKRNTGETGEAFEERTWREHMHTDSTGNIIIPGTAIKNCLSEVAKYLSESVPGKGKSTYTKHFEAGLLVPDPVQLPVKAADVKAERLFLPSDGKRGGGKRVWKNYPIIHEWEGVVEIVLLDPALEDKPAKVKEYLEHAGKFIGIGRFRPRNNGFYGRFTVTKFECN